MSLITKHKRFIETPLIKELEKGVNAVGIFNGEINFFPLRDYYIQSIFLNLTGFQEQKIKCICWDIATNDYEYRRKLLNSDGKLGECSAIVAKSKVYKTILTKIKEIDSSFVNRFTEIKKDIADKNKVEIENIFDKTIFQYWFEREYKYFEKDKILSNTANFATTKNLLEGQLLVIYSFLYDKRNSLAHNTLSYQENTPTFNTLLKTDFVQNNYFIWIAVLNLIDKIFIELYTTYLDLLEQNIY